MIILLFLLLLVPALIAVLLYEWLKEYRFTNLKRVALLLIFSFFINLVTYAAIWIRGWDYISWTFDYTSVTTGVSFCIKYMTLSLVSAVIIPFILSLVGSKERQMIRLQIKKRKKLTLIVLLAVTVLFICVLYFTKPKSLSGALSMENNTENTVYDIENMVDILVSSPPDTENTFDNNDDLSPDSEKMDDFLDKAVAESVDITDIIDSTAPIIDENAESIECNQEDNDLLITNMLTQLERQAQIDDMLLKEIDSGTYSFNDPLVIVDPYSISPLSAIALFTSNEPINISIHISGRTEFASFDFTFDGYNTRHFIPIYGLYPDEQNIVELTSITQDGQIKKSLVTIKTDPLPPGLADNIILTETERPESYQTGLNYTFVQKSAFDINGEYRWFYYDFGIAMATQYSYNGNMIFAKGSYHEGDVLLFEVNSLGKIMSIYYSPYGAHHNITDIDGKNLLVNGSYGATSEDFLYEINIESGDIINTLSFQNILQRTRPYNYSDNESDWMHHNATIYDNGTIIISGRSQSAIVKLSWPDGKIEWILSDHIGWNSMFQNYLLTPSYYYFEWPYAQHAPIILPDFDSNPDTIDILLFDNGVNRYINDRDLQRAIANKEIVAPERYSRMVHYRINEKTKTVEQIWQFGKELGETYYSVSRGNADFLENGNRLGTFEITDQNNVLSVSVIEVDSRGQIIWEAFATSFTEFGAYSAYRCERLPLYTAAANDLQIGIPARNFIPEDKLP